MTTQWQNNLRSAADPDKIKILSSFFKTGPGQYGEGDRFIGLTVPANRAIAKRYSHLPCPTIKKMLDSEIHEFRLSGFLALVEKYRKARTDEERRDIVTFYLDNAERANNWDLVDLSAPKILGEWLRHHPDPQLLYSLHADSCIWRTRIAIVSTYTLIKAGSTEEILTLAERSLSHPHELIHKAVGWMLREAGKKDQTALCTFLDRYATLMPRTALRYAVERLPDPMRRHYMQLR